MLTERDKQILIHIENPIVKAITVKQCANIFFKDSSTKYELARRRLKHLEENKYLKSYRNETTKQLVYYSSDEKVSAHNLYILDFLAKLYEIGCQKIIFQKPQKLLNGSIRPDAFLGFYYKDRYYFVLLEVDFTHATDLSKFQNYERLYKTGELQEKCYGIFPKIIVMSLTNTPNLVYSSNNFDVKYLNFKLDNFDKVVL